MCVPSQTSENVSHTNLTNMREEMRRKNVVSTMQVSHRKWRADADCLRNQVDGRIRLHESTQLRKIKGRQRRV